MCQLDEGRYIRAAVNLDQLNSLVEDNDMLAENLENWAKKERLEGRLEGKQETARNLIKLGVLGDEQIAEATGLTVAEVGTLREEAKH